MSGNNNSATTTDSMGAQVPFWRGALHGQTGPSPHVFEDEVSLRLVASVQGWRGQLDLRASTSLIR